MNGLTHLLEEIKKNHERFDDEEPGERYFW